MVAENRNRLVLDTRLTLATGTVEPDAFAQMLEHKPAARRVTLRANRGYDPRGFVEKLRELRVTPLSRRTRVTAGVRLTIEPRGTTDTR